MFFPWKTPKDKGETSFSTVFSYFANLESNNDTIDPHFSFNRDTWMAFWTQEVLALKGLRIQRAFAQHSADMIAVNENRLHCCVVLKENSQSMT